VTRVTRSGFNAVVDSPCYNQPRVSRPKFRPKTNSTVVWLYDGGVSLILPDVQIGMVSLEYIYRSHMLEVYNINMMSLINMTFWWLCIHYFMSTKL